MVLPFPCSTISKTKRSSSRRSTIPRSSSPTYSSATWSSAIIDNSRSSHSEISLHARNWLERILPTGTTRLMQDLWHAQTQRLPQFRQDDRGNREGIHCRQPQDVPIRREFSGTVLRVAQRKRLLSHPHQLHDI